MRPAIAELKSSACDQILDGAGNQDLVWTGQSSNARTDMNRNPDHLVTRKFAFAGVQSGAYLKSQPVDPVAHRTGTANRSRRSIENGEQAVPGSVDFAASKGAQLFAHQRIPVGEQAAPM